MTIIRSHAPIAPRIAAAMRSWSSGSIGQGDGLAAGGAGLGGEHQRVGVQQLAGGER